MTMFVADNTYFVMAGEVYVTDTPICLLTTLGSCIAVVAWHPHKRIVGMCHYLLACAPIHSQKDKNFYGCFAVDALLCELARYAEIRSYRFSLFGGGSLFNLEADAQTVGKQNIRYAEFWAEQNKIQFSECSVGGDICRSIRLYASSGELKVNVYPMNKENRA